MGKYAPHLPSGRQDTIDWGDVNAGKLYDVVVIGKNRRGNRFLIVVTTLVLSGLLTYWLYLLIFKLDQESKSFDPLSGPIILSLVIIGIIWLSTVGNEQLIVSRDGILRRNPATGDLFIEWQDFTSVSIAASGNQTKRWSFQLKSAILTLEFKIGGNGSWYVAENISKNIPKDRWINPEIVESCIKMAQDDRNHQSIR